MPDYGLSIQQLTVICALSSGATTTAAAEQAGVHRNTIANWRRNSLPFQQGFAHAQYDRALYYREKIEDLIDLAIKSLHDILIDPKAPPSVKLKAALSIIQTASTPPAPKKQVELDIEKIVIQRTPPQTVTEDQLEPAPPVHNDPQSDPQIGVAAQPVTQSLAAEPPSPNSPLPPTDAQPAPVEPQPAMHNGAQPDPAICVNSRPFAADSSAHRPRNVARNAKCPCGSGRKYKRCCLDSASGPLATAA